jgi:hypothetical protein
VPIHFHPNPTAPVLTAPVLNTDEWGLDVYSLIFDPQRRVLYVGCHSYDPNRFNLVVFPVEPDGTTLGKPSWFPDHPSPLSASHSEQPHSRIRALALRGDCLYMSVLASDTQPKLDKSLVVYKLDSRRGMPAGAPEAFSSGNEICYALALHPKQPLLFTAGLNGLGVIPLGSDGRPTRPLSGPTLYGRHRCTSVSVSPDGQRLCVGTRGPSNDPWSVEVFDIEQGSSPDNISLTSVFHGSVLSSDPSEQALNGEFAASSAEGDLPQGYASVTLAGTGDNSVIYYLTPPKPSVLRGPPALPSRRALRYFVIPKPGQSAGSLTPSEVWYRGGMHVIGRTTSGVGGDYLLAVGDSEYADAFNQRRPVWDGIKLLALPLDSKGKPAGAVIEGPRLPHAKVMDGSPISTYGPALATKSAVPGEWVPGSRTRGLSIQVRLPSLTGYKNQVPSSGEAAIKVVVPIDPNKEYWPGSVGPHSNPLVTALIDLDPHLQNREGLIAVGVWLTRPDHLAMGVERAEIKLDILQNGQLIRSVTVLVAGASAVVLFPGYDGIDSEDPADIAKRVMTTEEWYGQFVKWAHDATAAATGSSTTDIVVPARTVTATALHTKDTSTSALQAGLNAIKQLGFNTISMNEFISSLYGGLTSSTRRGSAISAGFRRFYDQSNNFPGAAFDPRFARTPLDKYVQSLVRNAEARGLLPDRGLLSLEPATKFSAFIWGDEIGSAYETDDYQTVDGRGVRELILGFPQDPSDPHNTNAIQVYRKYLSGVLTSLGESGQEVFGADLDGIEPPRLSDVLNNPSIEVKRLFFWTVRFTGRTFAEAQAQLLPALAKGFGAEFPVGPYPQKADGYRNQPIRLFNGKTITPDIFEIGRVVGSKTQPTQTTECLSLETNFTDTMAQLASLHADLVRSAALRPGMTFGAKMMGHWIGSLGNLVPDGAASKTMAFAGRGAAVIEFYRFGEGAFSAQDEWCDRAIAYEPIARAIDFLGKTERLFTSKGVMPANKIALLWPMASQIWCHDVGEPYYMVELLGLHAAFIHTQYNVDFVDDVDVEEGILQERGYKALYITAPNLSTQARLQVLDWVRAGGSLVLLPGAASRDEYDVGVEQGSRADLYREAGIGPVPTQDEKVTPHETKTIKAAWGTLLTAYPVYGLSRGQLGPVLNQPTQLAEVEFDIPDRPGMRMSVAVGREKIGTGQGRIITLGFWPGVTYWKSSDVLRQHGEVKPPFLRMPRNWAVDARAAALMPCLLAGVGKHVELPRAGIETLVLSAPRQALVTLLPWSDGLIEDFGATKDSLVVSLRDPSLLTALSGNIQATSVRHGPLKTTMSGNTVNAVLPSLVTVDAIVFAPPSLV